MAMTIFLQQSSFSATDSFSRRPASKVEPRIISQLKHDSSFIPKHMLFRLGDFNAGLQIRRNMNDVAVHASVPPQAPFPSDHSPAHWKVWILGAAVAILVSFSKGKWGPLLKLKEKAETTIEELEEISDAVEEVAEKVDEVAEAAAKHLPEGKLQDAAEFIEKVAERIDENAHIAGDVLHKVEEMGKEVESLLGSNTHQEKTKDQK
ncbi:hypothetical protein K1719_022025 [Acacia pycnantha]|nr:hypothetical protein K1719_022025 [Acacia pycnantha]